MAKYPLFHNCPRRYNLYSQHHRHISSFVVYIYHSHIQMMKEYTDLYKTNGLTPTDYTFLTGSQG